MPWKTIAAGVLSTLICSQTLAAPPNLVPAETTEIKELLFACDRALNTCQGALGAKEALIAQQQRSLEALASENASLRGRDDKLWKSPFFHFVLGMLTTGVVFHLVKPSK